MKYTEVIEIIGALELKEEAEKARSAWNHGPNAAHGVYKALKNVDSEELRLKLVNARSECGGLNWLAIAAQIHDKLQTAA